MTALPEWMVGGLTAADYDALPEEICHQIEVVDGQVVVSPSPRRPHQRVVQRLVNILDAACDPEFTAVIDVDLRLRDVPLLNRRPDIVVYNSAIPSDEVLRPQHCLLVVEVMSPGSVSTDRTDKPAEYATAGINHFWRLEFDAGERKLTVFRYRLDPTTRVYTSAGMSTGKMVVSDPFEVSVDLDELM
ncbi:MAG TPA: Uma2 family endonuclease [Actinophytocola sp.]|jgi:Uma2 family endonuclease|uniref:Uma2 family endonuclease n=1 Tax=Actinophytocola sp. TaxID=1872138 RepID=UPI002E05960D|nr:Uma2 family endonuclease [Actinophytocola sp.]